jgi:hypothetical protein
MNAAPKEAYPLSWPDRWPKPQYRYRARFTATRNETRTYGQNTSIWRVKVARSIETAREVLFAELNRLGASGIILSSNLRVRKDGLPISAQAQPADPSIAVYFTLKNKPHVLACGKWDRAQDNIWAIAKHVEALRGQERWGVGSIEQAFRGYTAIPETTSGFSWWEVLGVAMNASAEQVRIAYYNKAKLYHPDSGTEPNHEKMVEVNRAYEQATAQKA